MSSVSNTISARMEENRTAFIHDLFSKNGTTISYKDVIKAWKEAGGRDKMVPSRGLYRYARDSWGRKSKMVVKINEPSKQMVKPSVRPNTATKDYVGMERALDNLVFQATAMGDSSLTEEIRTLRRSVTKRMVNHGS